MGGWVHMLFEVCLNCRGRPVEFIQCEALRDLADNKVFVSFARGSEEKIAHPPSQQQCTLFSVTAHSLRPRLCRARSDVRVTRRLKFEQENELTTL